MDIRAFEPGHVDGAARILAAKHARRRGSEPLLPPDYDSSQACVREVRAALDAGATGLAAESDGTVGAFLLAIAGDDVRGAHVWSGLGSHGHAEDPDMERALYAYLAGAWVAEGLGHHYVVSSSTDTDTWLDLGFAYEQVHGIRGTAVEGVQPVRFDVRRAGPEDVDALESLFPLIGDAHLAAPTLAFIEQGFFDDLRGGHLELLTDPSVGYWLAESSGDALGYAALKPVREDEASMLHPVGAVELTVAATTPEARGRGVMRALLASALAWAREEGYRSCVTDWRAANLDSSRTWPRLGFRPVAYRFHRIVDPRLLP